MTVRLRLVRRSPNQTLRQMDRQSLNSSRETVICLSMWYRHHRKYHHRIIISPIFLFVSVLLPNPPTRNPHRSWHLKNSTTPTLSNGCCCGWLPGYIRWASHPNNNETNLSENCALTGKVSSIRARRHTQFSFFFFFSFNNNILFPLHSDEPPISGGMQRGEAFSSHSRKTAEGLSLQRLSVCSCLVFPPISSHTLKVRLCAHVDTFS